MQQQQQQQQQQQANRYAARHSVTASLKDRVHAVL
jgi:hypothetical protein